MPNRRNYKDRYKDIKNSEDKISDEKYSRDNRIKDHRHDDEDYVRKNLHSHHFSAISGKAIPLGEGNHMHEVKFLSDIVDNHFHEFYGKTGGVKRIGDRH